jgi:acetyl-CoA acetyltransferase
MRDILFDDGLTDPISEEIMGEQAERLATTYQIRQFE